MKTEAELKSLIIDLDSKLKHLASRDSETEKKAEEYLRQVFEALGWDWLGSEVMPQKRVKSGGKTKRVDYSFKKTGRIKPDFYMEVKKFSENLGNPSHVEQAISYGKNSGIRWVLLTNFSRWCIFNSDYFDSPGSAELFEFDLFGAASDPEKMRWLMLFSKEQGGGPALDDYAKKHKKWKESESVEDLLTEQLISTRKALSAAIREQNHDLFDPEPEDEDNSVDSCVQHILDRLIFCRMLEDNGSDSGYRMDEERRRWEGDKRVQFYREFLSEFWVKMRKRYDSTIFDSHRIDGLVVKNEDFMPVFDSFYINPKTKLRYRFEAIGTDILGHTYDNYLSYKPKQTAKRTGLEKEIYRRKQSGIYYTPEFLVDHLVRTTLGKKLEECKFPAEALKLRVLDPACGSGTFLVRAFGEFRHWYLVREKKNGNGDGEVQGLPQFLDSVLENCIYGIDLDPRAVRLAKLNLFLQAIDTPNRLPRLKIAQKNSLLNDGGFRNSFDIQREFPLVAEAGGFDVIIGNPPWERFEIKTQEFFEQFDEGFKELGTKQAKKRAEELLTRAHIKQEWQIKNAEYEALASHYQGAYNFQVDSARKTMGGHTDLYKLFTERAYQLAKDGGMVGLVVPSGIYTDLGTKSLRRMLYDYCEMKELYSFENRGHAIFSDVHASYKFVLLTFQKGGKTSSFPCAFFLHDEEALKKAIENPTSLSVDFVKSSSPISWSVTEIKSGKDFAIVEKMLAFDRLGGPTWNLKPFQGFNMTTDSHLFQSGKLGVPLLEGKNIHQFTHHWREAPETRFTVSERNVQKNLKPEKQYQNGYWIGYRLIASSTNERTLICTMLPAGYVCGHSMAVIMLPDLKKAAYLTGMLNSFVVDYIIRQKMSTNINFNFFLELPIPSSGQAGAYYEQIAKKAAQLVATTGEFEQLKKEIGIPHGITEENDRLLARAQLDAMVAKLYGITKEELAHILEKFPIADAKQKEAVLREYG